MAILFSRDAGGLSTFAPSFTEIVARTTLAANVEQNFEIPESKDATNREWVAIFSFTPGAIVFVQYTPPNIALLPATVPGAGFAIGNFAILNPAARRVQPHADIVVNPGGKLSFITPTVAGAYVVVELHANQ